MSYKSEAEQLFLNEDVWQRTNPTWKLLKPNRDFNSWSENDESMENYQQRIASLVDVPIEVIKQWLYIHYNNSHTVDNYGWLDYSKIVFRPTKWKVSEIVSLNVIDAYSMYVHNVRSTSGSFADFRCIKSDLEYWQTYKTWRTPPIILDTRNLEKVPNHSDITLPFQLVEGHTRLGYFLALYDAQLDGTPYLADEHFVYIMSMEMRFSQI